MALDKELIDKLLEAYQKPEDLIGEKGLLICLADCFSNLRVRGFTSTEIRFHRLLSQISNG
jgi:hypothetical protein